MISLNQVQLLAQKVESAVAKIAQLQGENDALRKKCAELTNALSAKSEQLNTYEQEQGRIEAGIIQALDRLNVIESNTLQSAVQPTLSGHSTLDVQNPSQNVSIQESSVNNNQLSENPVPFEEKQQFYDMQKVEQSEPTQQDVLPAKNQDGTNSAEGDIFSIF